MGGTGIRGRLDLGFVRSRGRLFPLEKIVQFRHKKTETTLREGASDIHKQRIVDLFISGMQDDWDALVFLAQHASHFAAGHSRHRVIEDHRTEFYLPEQVDGGVPVLGRHYVEPLAFQHDFQWMENSRLIIDAQNYEVGFGHLIPCPD